MGNYKINDKYFKKAKAQGYRARSVFKLQEIQEKFHLLKTGDKVLDLGAAPGSWLQFISKKIGPNGRAIGLDLTPVSPLPYQNVKTVVADIYDSKKIAETLGSEGFNVITSDLAPNTSGIKDLDQGRSVALNEQALVLAKDYLKPGGSMIIKIFRGADFADFLKTFKKLFQKSSVFKAKASRDTSSEVYLIGVGSRL